MEFPFILITIYECTTTYIQALFEEFNYKSFIRQMGNHKSKTIEVDNIEYHLSKCEELSQKNCPVYGNLHLVLYNNLEIFLGESHSTTPPADVSLHYLVTPNLLVIPQFTLLENAKPSSFDSLLDLITGVAEMSLNGQIGFGHNRVGFAGRWGTVGEKALAWGYHQVFKDPNTTGVYLSPQLVLGLSQEKLYPKHDPIKSDMFAFGIMLLQIIFQQRLTHIFDYRQFQIKLKPLLEKLNVVKQQFGEPFYTVILKMLELDEQERIDFRQLLDLIGSLGKKSTMLSSRMHSSAANNSNEYSTRSPLGRKTSAVYRNDCSPFRGGNALVNSRVPERINNRTPTKQSRLSFIHKQNRSPLKRDLRIQTQYDRQSNQNTPGHMSSRSPNKPVLLRKQGVSPLSKR